MKHIHLIPNLLLLLVTALCTSTSVYAQQEIPCWVKEKVDTVYEKMVQYINGDEALVFPLITDLHLTSSGAYNHIDYTLYADRLMTFDFVVNLGDLGLDVGTDTPEKASALLRDVYNRHAGFRGVTLFAVGNHDGNHNFSNNLVSEKEWITRFITPQQRKCPSKLIYQNSYGYYDIERTKTRVITLNTSDGDNKEHSTNFYAMSATQLKWLASALQFKEKGWNVIILTHFCANPLGKWNNYESSMENTDIFDAIMYGFKNKTSGSMRNIYWNFSSNKSNDLVANLCGDSHFDNASKKNGINRIITQGYGGVSEEELPVGASKWNKGADMIIDIVVLKPQQKEFTLFRLGVGKDRFFTY